MKSTLTMVLAVASLCISCQKQSSPFLQSQKEILRLSISGEPDSLDPRKSNNINADLVIKMLFQGLTSVDSQGKMALALAESVEISEDQMNYKIVLRDSFWSDGHPVIAQDFETSWKASLKTEAPVICANLLYPLKNAEAAKRGKVSVEEVGVYAQDTKTLMIQLEKPTSFFLDLMASTMYFPVPSHLVQNVGEWGSSASEQFVSNGPFKLASWEHNHKLKLYKNLFFCDKELGLIDEIDVAIIGNEMTALQMFERGELDCIGGDFSPLPLDAIPLLSAQDAFVKTTYGGTRYCPFNMHAFPFNNANMRKAFSIAICRTAIVDNITHLHEEVATHMIAPCLKGNHHVDFFQDGDVETARSYFAKGLEELGVTRQDLDGAITLKYEDAEISSRIAQALQQQWYDAFGLRVNLEHSELKTFVTALRQRNFQIGLIYWMLHYNSAMDILDRYRTADLVKNYPGWESSEYTSLIDDFFLEPDEEKRNQILLKAEAVFMNDMPVAPLYHFCSPYMLKPEVTGLETTPIGDFYFGNVSIKR
ncbi:MAG: peptide ABC transporter substrate-binding protein [Chlamydiota bacterium]